MKISEITIQNIKDYVKIEYTEDDALINSILTSVKAYIKSYTGLDDITLDKKEDLSIVLMILCNEMYNNREYTVKNDKINVVVRSILDIHCINLL